MKIPNEKIEKDGLTTGNYLLFGNYKGNQRPIGVINDSSELKIDYKFQISQSFKHHLISIEDKRYFLHNGVDYKSIARAIYINIKSLSLKQGGSTITQQLARNLIRDNNKNILRKIRETQLALYLEKHHSKDEILDLYFNNVYWGKNIYGIRGASITYFDKEPSALNKSEKVQLITLLRGPNLYLNNVTEFQKRFTLLNNLIFSRLESPPKQRLKKVKPISVKNNLSIIKPTVLDFINSSVDHSKSSIFSTIEIDLQKELDSLVKQSKYPTSIVCFYKGELVGFSSFYGSDYPFNFKSNVGSLLKPFIYVFLRKSGITTSDLFSTKSKSNWQVREVQEEAKDFLSLKQALLASNNNTFINASRKVHIDNVIEYIKILTDKKNEKLFPSAILGTSATGMSLFQISKLYHEYFSEIDSLEKQECLEVLNELLFEKTGLNFKNGYFKTGTTNNNKERFSIFGNKLMTVGILRQNYYENDYSKEGNFIGYIRNVLNKIISLKNKWFR